MKDIKTLTRRYIEDYILMGGGSTFADSNDDVAVSRDVDKQASSRVSRRRRCRRRRRRNLNRLASRRVPQIREQ